MRKLKRKLNVLLVLLLLITNVKAASVYANYSKATKNTDNYITKFSKYKLFIDSTNKYLYNGSTLSVKSGFNEGGFLNTYEFNSTIIRNDSYLITGARYFTMTENGNNVDAVDVRKINSVSKTDSLESRITELVIPETRVSGSGSRNNPWKFITPEFNVTIKLVNAKISGKDTINEIVIGYNKTYTITPNESYYIFNDKTGDLVCDKTVGSYKVVDNKLVLEDLRGDATCSVRYRGMDVTANIVVNNGTATNSKLIGEAGSDLSTSLKGNNGYAYDTVSCTNSQTATYEPKVLTINKIIKNTTCTVNYGRPNDKTFTFVASAQTYTIPYNGFYTFELLGAEGENNGGKGAKTAGTIYFTKGDVVVINTGGSGNNTGIARGYNGGGIGQYYGGGASTVKKNGTILIAAAGGGGGANGTAGGNGTGTGGASVGSGAGSRGTNAGGGGSSYDHKYQDNCSSCYTGHDTCVGGYVTECSDKHHKDWVCSGGWVDTEYGHGYGDRWFECTSNGWYGHGSGNVSCSPGDTKHFSCSNPTPSGKCTIGDERYYPNACYGYCTGREWNDCANESYEWVYGCDDVWSDCKTGENTCRPGCDTLTKGYKPGNGGSNIYSTSVKNITKTNGYNKGNGQVKVSFHGEEL